MTLAAALVGLALSAAGAGETEVTFDGAGGLPLRGTLARPPGGGGDRPAVLLLAGSGPTDRDGNQSPGLVTDLLKPLGQRLAAGGIVSLRFDKRAAPTYRHHWPADPGARRRFFAWPSFTGDVLAAYRHLRGQPDVDGSRVGVIGHSEGGLLALQSSADLAAAPAAFLVLLAVPGRPLGDVIQEQVRDALARRGAPDEVRQAYRDAIARAIRQVVRTRSVPPDLPAALAPIFPPDAADFLRVALTLDPAALAADYAGPVLILQGAHDTQVSPARDAERLAAARSRRPPTETRLVVVPRASHSFKTVSGPDDPGFAGPVVPHVLDELLAWIERQPPGSRR